jgi:hypothetical protein
MSLPTIKAVTTIPNSMDYFIEYQLSIAEIITNQGSQTYYLSTEDRIIGLFMNNSWQTVILTNCNFPYQKTTDVDGNPIAILPNLYVKPGGSLTINVTYSIYSRIAGQRTLIWDPELTAVNSGTIEDIPLALKTAYCKPVGPWNYEQPSWEFLRRLAFQIQGNERNTLKVVYKFVDWLAHNIMYPTNAHETPMYPTQTYTHQNQLKSTKGEGDCDDQASLFVTFCRIVGIPAFMQIGCIYLPDQYKSFTVYSGHVQILEEQIGWHGWAMVYIPPWGWIPIDLTWLIDRAGATLSQSIHWTGPNSTIIGAAVLTPNTAIYQNITQSDYIKPSIESINKIRDASLYITEMNSMKAVGTAPIYGSASATQLTPSIALLVIAAVMTVSIYLYARKKRLERTRHLATPSYF